MKKTVKEAWLKALRNGEYEQGRNRLFDGKKFCCLGVLYDIAVDGYWKYDGENGWVPSIYRGDNFPETHLSDEGYEDLGLKHECMLASMNDAGYNFDEIADWIEKNVGVY
jgi:hypothetical protein